MLKKITLFVCILNIGACSSFGGDFQCDPNKNYIYSDHKLISQYKEKQLNNELKSIYSKNYLDVNCRNDRCVYFDTKKYSYLEKFFDNEKMKGVYTIYATKNLNRNDCFEHDPIFSKGDKICFYAIKNEKDYIKSRYYHETSYLNNIKKETIYDKEEKKYIFVKENQTYRIGQGYMSSAGFCKIESKSIKDEEMYDIL